MILNLLKWSILLSVARTSINVYKQGWLDRVVQYHKQKFIDDVQRLPPVQIKAKIAAAPEGYVESKGWDFDSVMRLLTLMRESEESRPAYRQLRRMLLPTRRILMSRNHSYHLFPNIDPDNYYESSQEYVDEEYSEEEIIVEKRKKKKKGKDGKDGKDGSPGAPGESGDDSDSYEDFTDSAIVYISNPVEARLPSGSISVDMLRGIMESRALAARIMPSTSPSTIQWIPMNRTEPHAGGAPDGGAPDGGAGPSGADSAGGNTTEGEASGGDAPVSEGTAEPEPSGGDDESKKKLKRAHRPENYDYESDEYEDKEVTTKKVNKKRKLTTTTPRKKNKKGAKKIKRRGQAVRYGRKRKQYGRKRKGPKVMVPQGDRLFIPFRAKNHGPRPLKESHPLRNGLAGGYYENYQRAKYTEQPHKKHHLAEVNE